MDCGRFVKPHCDDGGCSGNDGGLRRHFTAASRRIARSTLLLTLSVASVGHAQSVIASSGAATGAQPTPMPRPLYIRTASASRRLFLDTYLLAGFNPLSGALIVGLRHQWNHARHPNVLLDNRREELGIEVNANPAYTDAAIYTEWTPLQVLVLRAQMDAFVYYGIFGAILRFPSAGLAFGDQVRVDRESEARPGVVTRFLSQATLQVQVGPVIARNSFEVDLIALHGDEEHWIDLQRDLLLSRRELLFTNDAQLLVEPYRRPDGTGLYVGGYHHIAYARYSGYRRQRLGLMGEWIFARQLWRMQKPRLIALSAYHLEDRNRQGGFYLIAAIGGEFDL